MSSEPIDGLDAPNPGVTGPYPMSSLCVECPPED